MASDPGFVAHALDLLALLGPVEARAMFGGHGLYGEGVMFGLLDDGELFLKTDDATRERFVGAGCRRWTYVNKKVRMENTGYFRPPDDAHEDPEAMLPWARLALEAALRSSVRPERRGAERPEVEGRARAAKARRPSKNRKKAPARVKATPAKAPARPARRKTR